MVDFHLGAVVEVALHLVALAVELLVQTADPVAGESVAGSTGSTLRSSGNRPTPHTDLDLRSTAHTARCSQWGWMLQERLAVLALVRRAWRETVVHMLHTHRRHLHDRLRSYYFRSYVGVDSL